MQRMQKNYIEDPILGRPNGRTKAANNKIKEEDPPVSAPAKGGGQGTHQGVGRPGLDLILLKSVCDVSILNSPGSHP